MAIYRIKRTRNFVILPNDLAQNKALSYKARGLLTYLLSKPEDWTVQFHDLVSEIDGKDAVRSGLKELRTARYIQWVPSHNALGHRTWEYHVYDTPQTEIAEKPYTENPYTENPDMDYSTDNVEVTMSQYQEALFDDAISQSDFPTKVVKKPCTENPYTEKPYTENPDTYKEQILQKTEIYKEQTEEKESTTSVVLRSAGASSTPTVATWPDEHVVLQQWLQRQNLLMLAIPQDFDWWASLSWIVNGMPSPEWLGREFSKMQLWIEENPRKKPTPRGTSRFIRGWLERTYEKERRHGPSTKNASQRLYA